MSNHCVNQGTRLISVQENPTISSTPHTPHPHSPGHTQHPHINIHSWPHINDHQPQAATMQFTACALSLCHGCREFPSLLWLASLPAHQPHLTQTPTNIALAQHSMNVWGVVGVGLTTGGRAPTRSNMPRHPPHHTTARQTTQHRHKHAPGHTPTPHTQTHTSQHDSAPRHTRNTRHSLNLCQILV